MTMGHSQCSHDTICYGGNMRTPNIVYCNLKYNTNLYILKYFFLVCLSSRLMWENVRGLWTSDLTKMASTGLVKGVNTDPRGVNKIPKNHQVNLPSKYSNL